MLTSKRREHYVACLATEVGRLRWQVALLEWEMRSRYWLKWASNVKVATGQQQLLSGW